MIESGLRVEGEDDFVAGLLVVGAASGGRAVLVIGDVSRAGGCAVLVVGAVSSAGGEATAALSTFADPPREQHRHPSATRITPREIRITSPR